LRKAVLGQLIRYLLAILLRLANPATLDAFCWVIDWLHRGHIAVDGFYGLSHPYPTADGDVLSPAKKALKIVKKNFFNVPFQSF
jgi:hypothetical protein